MGPSAKIRFRRGTLLLQCTQCSSKNMNEVTVRLNEIVLQTEG